MVFSSMIFILFLFLVLVADRIIPTRSGKNVALLVFSLIFFAWGGLEYLILLLVMAAINWYGALVMGGLKSVGRRRPWLRRVVGLDILLFALFRFWRLMPWSGAESGASRYLMPMGMAFYTLQLIRYVVEVYRGTAKPKQRYWQVLLYGGLFFSAAGGPLVPDAQLRQDLERRKIPRSADLSRGMMRFSCGLAKKVVLANACQAAAEAIFGGSAATVAQAPVLAVWLGGIFYLMQLYLDLSGYADMAIGIGLLLGFHLPENFDYPYAATSLRSFWHRWNITVVNFFKEYVYLPLGGSSQGTAMAGLNLLITWLLFGLWNGSYPNYVIWAVYWLVLLVVEKLLAGRLPQLPLAVSRLCVLLALFVGGLLFRFTDLGMLATALRGLIGLNHAGFVNAATGSLLLRHLILLVVAGVACTPLTTLAGMVWNGLGRERRGWFYAQQVWNAVCPVVLLVLCAAALVGNDVASFLYFQA